MKRKAHDTEQVVRVEPGTLPVGLGPEGKEVLEDSPVDNHAGHQRNQHEHSGQADDIHADVTGVQVVVQLEEELTADRFRHRHSPCATGIETDVMEGVSSIHFPAQPPVGLPFGRAVHPERMKLFMDVLLHPASHVIRTDMRCNILVQRWAHPACQLLVEAGQGAREDDHEEQPTGQQPAPGVQPRHALAQRHGRVLKSPERNAARHSTAVRPISESQTRKVLRAANTYTATAIQTAKLPRLENTTRSGRARGR